MAGQVRQPIDVASLERYVAANVPEIQVPLDVKQVCLCLESYQSDTNQMVVRLWAVKSDIPVDGQEWQEVCYEEEASGSTSVEGTIAYEIW